MVNIMYKQAIYKLELTCVYLSFECKVEKLTIRIEIIKKKLELSNRINKINQNIVIHLNKNNYE